MSLGYKAHSMWDSNHKQNGKTQKIKEKKNKIGQKDILNFKQKTMSVCLSKFIYVSMYVFVFG